MKTLYIIAGPNGAGKTTASYTVLPGILNCKEFVNADEIAKGISPFNSTVVSLQAGRMMLQRINKLLHENETFALETTLSTKSYVSFIRKAKEKGYRIVLLFLRLKNKELAIERVRIRVEEGGHNIPTEVIKRRFNNGLFNLFNLYLPIVDEWMIMDSSQLNEYKYIATGGGNDIHIKDKTTWDTLKIKYNGN